jgi:single-strand DNA-binding protein
MRVALHILSVTTKGVQAALDDGEGMWLPRAGAVTWDREPVPGETAVATIPRWLVLKHRPLRALHLSAQKVLGFHEAGLEPSKADNALPAAQQEGQHTMNSIEVACVGRVGRDAELKTSQSGKPWARVSVGVGKDDSTQWIAFTIFGEMAVDMASRLTKGASVYVEGRELRIDSYTTQAGEQRHGLKAVATKIEVVGAGAIGHNKAPRQRAPEGDAPAPSSTGGGGFGRDEVIPFGSQVL